MPATISNLLAPQGPVVSAIRAQLPNAMAIYAFGSQVQGTAEPNSELDLRAASTVMQYQVITTGQRLWSIGLAVGLFETYVLSEKTALDEAHAPLLADGKVRFPSVNPRKAYAAALPTTADFSTAKSVSSAEPASNRSAKNLPRNDSSRNRH